MAEHNTLSAAAENHEPLGMAEALGGATDVGKVIASLGDGTSTLRKLTLDDIEGALTGFKYVNSLSDLPTPVAGVITLDTFTTYVFGTVNIGANRIQLSQYSMIAGISPIDSAILYTGTGSMFTATDASHYISDIRLDATNGTVWDITDTAGNFFRLSRVFVSNAASLGTFTTTSRASVVFNELIGGTLADGMTFSGNFAALVGTFSSGEVTGTGTYIDLGTATFDYIDINSGSITLQAAGTTFMSGAASSANLNVGGRGFIRNMLISNLFSGTVLNGITSDDARWNITEVSEQVNTRPDALGYFSGNATATTITATSTPVKINATWTEDHSSQFTVTTDGKMTYNGTTKQRLPIDLNINAQMASASTDDLKVYIAINGTVVTATGMPLNDVTASKAKNGSTMWQELLETGDYVEFYISNEGSTTDIIVTDAIGRIN